jgi:hypothetical protein
MAADADATGRSVTSIARIAPEIPKFASIWKGATGWYGQQHVV